MGADETRDAVGVMSNCRMLSARYSIFVATLVLWVLTILLAFDYGHARTNPMNASVLATIVILVSAGTARLIIGNKALLEDRIGQRTEALQIAMENALAASRAKSGFLADMSHELRTPMNGILGMIGIVLDSSMKSDQREHLETARQCANSLLALLNGILDLSKIESGKMLLEKEPFRLGQVVDDCIRAHELKARRQGIELHEEIDRSLPVEVVGDELRFRQIVSNLLSNAVKFTERGTVTVSLRNSQGTKEGVIAVDLEVSDTGAGIAAGRLPEIFEKFTQADGGISRKYGGTGLGLAITKKLVEMHGGKLRVESEIGCGSTFHVTLEFEAAPAKTNCVSKDRAAKPLESKPSGKVLLVEDNLVNQKIVAAILLKRGFSVVLAGNGREALEKLEIESFGLVLMDVQMPVLDGLEATRIIRQDVRWRRMPIVAMTAYAMNGDRERCLDAGMNGYVSKPVHTAQLLATVEQYISPIEVVARAQDVAPAPAVEIGAGIAQELVSLFIQLAPERLREMHNAASRADRGMLSDEARQMREAAGQIAATGVSNCARRIGEAADRGDLAKAKHSLLLLEAEIMRLGYRVKALPEYCSALKR